MSLIQDTRERIERTGLRLAARRHRGPRLLIMTWHRILAEPDPLLPGEPDAGLFDIQARFIAQHFTVLPLADAARQMADGSLPELAACITFDDGYANNLDVALPILQRHGLTATVFVATGLLGDGRMFNDTIIESMRACPAPLLDLSALNLGHIDLRDDVARAAAAKQLIERFKYEPPAARAEYAALIAERAGLTDARRLMMTPDELRQLHAAGIDIGAHTVSHPILTRLPAAEAQNEIDSSYGTLTDLLGKSPRTFAYPNGQPGQDYSAAHVEMVRNAGFECAVSTAARCAARNDDPFELPRVTIWSATSAKLTANLARIYASS